MAEDEQDETEIQVDFIPALDDAQLRLQCYLSIAPHGLDPQKQMLLARELYAWCIGLSEDEEQVEPGSTATEDKCSRKH